MMRSILVLVHILGALGIFMTAAAEFVALDRLQRATGRADAASWMKVLGRLRRPGGLSMLILLVSGIWLMAKYWHHQPWIDVAMAGLVVLMAIGGVMTGRSMRRLGRALSSASGDELTEEFRSLRAGTALTRSLRLRVAMAVGIVAIMTIKPGYGPSILIMGAAVAAGFLAGLRAAPGGSTQSAGAVHSRRDHSVVID